MKIINHDIMTCTHEQVGGNHLYGSRVLGLTEPDDVVQMHPALRSEWEAITNHYRRVGLTHSHQVIWDVSFAHVAAHPGRDASVFYFGDADHPESLRGQQFRQMNSRWHDVVRFMNCKNNFMSIARQLEVKVPHTLCFSTKADVNLEAPIPYPCYFKPSVSVDGMGIVRCPDQDTLVGVLETVPEAVSFQLQEEVLASSFLNLQYRVTDRGLERLAATEQILDGCSHSGNRFPTDHQPWGLVDPIAQWMYAQGMREIFAFDVAAVITPQGPRYYAIECNPRFNGASYPTGIARKLEIPSWTSETFKTDYRTLQDLDLRGLEYDCDRKTGVILVNWGSIHVGKMVCLLAGSIAEQNLLRSLLKQRLCEQASVLATSERMRPVFSPRRQPVLI